MSQQIRRAVLVLGLTAAFLLTATAPSHAAGARSSFMDKGFAASLWGWLENLLPGGTTPVAPVGRTVGVYEKEGSMIDPNGRPLPSGSTAPTSATSADEGSMIDPNGK